MLTSILGLPGVDWLGSLLGGVVPGVVSGIIAGLFLGYLYPRVDSRSRVAADLLMWGVAGAGVVLALSVWWSHWLDWPGPLIQYITWMPHPVVSAISFGLLYLVAGFVFWIGSDAESFD